MAQVKHLFYIITSVLSLCLVTACSERSDLAPVVELKWKPQSGYATTHKVQRGETLYAIAFRYDKDFRQLASYNNLRSPYDLRVGQLIQLQYPINKNQNWRFRHQGSVVQKTLPLRRAQPVNPQYSIHYAKPSGTWLWPAKGKIVANFIPQQGKKGIDIAGSKGETVRAASAGIVAYSGNGLSGYGNLIIIKHDGQFLTAYGNNLRNRVVEGERVKAGQIIAEMGIIDRKFWGVHFEIRRAGQPVNPLGYLQRG